MRSAVISDYLKVWPQYLLPQHWLSGLVYKLTRNRNSTLKNMLIRLFIRVFNVDMTMAEHGDATAYESFNRFFTRALVPDARPFEINDQDIISPVDGTVSQVGEINGHNLIQAKGRQFTLPQLLADDEPLTGIFRDGVYVTLYLSPRDYHRIHMPCDGRLLHTTYVPGRLFAVNAHTARVVDGLFARNERLINIFETDSGTMALIMVGAIFVGNMETVWAGEINYPYPTRVQHHDYGGESSVMLAQGEEMGRFNMGSTVILLFKQGTVDWLDKLSPEQPVRMGEIIGHCHKAG